jgi:hypothetical protein
MPPHRTLRWLFVLLILGRGAASQDAAPVRYGTWTATAGSSVFRGSWSAETLRHSPNETQGSWTLVNDANDLVLQGTWSAKRTGPHWHGIWRAETAQGQSFRGVWDADLPDAKGETFEGMLARTIEKEVAGFWQSGKYQGNWWLKGFKPKNKSRYR